MTEKQQVEKLQKELSEVKAKLNSILDARKFTAIPVVDSEGTERVIFCGMKLNRVGKLSDKGSSTFCFASMKAPFKDSTGKVLQGVSFQGIIRRNYNADSSTVEAF